MTTFDILIKIFIEIPIKLADNLINSIIKIIYTINKSETTVKLLSKISQIIIFIASCIPMFTWCIITLPIRIINTIKRHLKEKQLNKLPIKILEQIIIAIPFSIILTELSYNKLTQNRNYESEIRLYGYIKEHNVRGTK